jgi:hypothetical protein
MVRPARVTGGEPSGCSGPEAPVAPGVETAAPSLLIPNERIRQPLAVKLDS